jgi:hypothetical protein
MWMVNLALHEDEVSYSEHNRGTLVSKQIDLARRVLSRLGGGGKRDEQIRI